MVSTALSQACKVSYGGSMVVLVKTLVLSVVLFMLNFACAAPIIYVGAVDNSDAKVALVVEDGKVLAYSCGGNATWSTHSSWFPINEKSQLGEGNFTLTGAKGHVMKGFYNPEGATGTLTLPDGSQLMWSAEIARDNTPAGLYLLHEKSDEVEDLIGFIVNNDLQSVGNIRHILPRMSTTSFAPVGLAQALPEGQAESLTVCFTLDNDPVCKQLARASGTGL